MSRIWKFCDPRNAQSCSIGDQEETFASHLQEYFLLPPTFSSLYLHKNNNRRTPCGELGTASPNPQIHCSERAQADNKASKTGAVNKRPRQDEGVSSSASAARPEASATAGGAEALQVSDEDWARRQPRPSQKELLIGTYRLRTF